ncbi:hypothetical protein CLU79DRAFT_768133 [Phycomyces nitens]|nr:hypothetical protein CLU79DRAFT_768133 [Phycomyces nitens]
MMVILCTFAIIGYQIQSFPNKLAFSICFWCSTHARFPAKPKSCIKGCLLQAMGFKDKCVVISIYDALDRFKDLTDN